MSKKLLSALALLIASFGFLYWDVIAKLVHDWSVDENYSHGFLIVPLALYLAYQKRERLRRETCRPSNVGLLVVLLSLGLLAAGVLGAELFTTQVSILGTVSGSVLYLYGWGHLRIMLFPIALLFVMIPIPAIVLNPIAFPLQLLASRAGEAALISCRIPVLREGNLIHLANSSLEVAEACSGLRSLVSLLTLGILYGYFAESKTWIRLSLVLATVPVAILANGLRVAGTGIAAHFYGPKAAQGFFHTFSGWLVFVAAFAMLFVLHRVLLCLLTKPFSEKTSSHAA